MSTTDPGPTSPTTVGTRPGSNGPGSNGSGANGFGSNGSGSHGSGSNGSGSNGSAANGSGAARNGVVPQTAAAPARQAPARQAPSAAPRPDTARVPQPGARPAAPGQPAARQPTQPGQPARTGQPGQPGADPAVQRGGNGRILPPPAPGQTRPGQARPLQARPGQPGTAGQAAVGAPGSPRPGQPRPGQARAPRPGQPAPGPARGGRPGVRRGPRKARLSVARLDPWSVLKLSFLLSVALGIVGVVVTAVLWNVINGMGVFTDINTVVGQVQGDSDFNVYNFIGFERMFSASVVISVVNVAILTALATLFAFVYNISSGLVGGLHVTLTDE